MLMLFSFNSFSQGKIEVNILESIWTPPDTLYPIETAELTNSADATTKVLSEINKDLPDSSLMANYNETLITQLGILDSIKQEIETYPQDELRPRIINNFQTQLALLQTSFKKYKDQLDNSTLNIQKMWAIDDYLDRTWTLTINAKDDAAISESFKGRAEEILTNIKNNKKQIESISDHLLSLGDKLLTGSQTLNDFIQQMNSAALVYQQNNLKKTHPALWERDTTGMAPIKVKNVFNSFVIVASNGLKSFYSIYTLRIFLHLLILIFLLILFFNIRKKSKQWKEETNNRKIDDIIKIVQKPISLSLTIALFLGLFIYPTAPPIIAEIESLLILIPLVVVAMQVIRKTQYRFMFVVAGLFLFEELIETVKLDSNFLPQYIILIAMLATMAYVLWIMISQNNKRKISGEKRNFFMDISQWLSLLILTISVIANIFGYVSFGFFLFKGVIISVIAGVLLLVVVIIIEGFFNLIIMGNESNQYGMVREYGKMLVKRIVGVVKLLALLYWLKIVLRNFLIYDSVMGLLTDIFETKWVLGQITISLSGIILFFLVIFISIWLSKFLKILLEKEVFSRMKLSRGVPGMINLVMKYSIVTIGFFISLGMLGIDLDKLTILMGALGVGIGFGLQDIINNLISGFILVFERPIQAGDIVQFGAKEGKVQEIGIRSSTIKTYDGSAVIVPNGMLISNELINLTLSDPILRVEVNIGVEYGAEPQDVIDILLMQAKLHEKIIDNPDPFAIFLGFGDFSLNFRLYAYTRAVNSRLSIRSELNLAIFHAVKESGIKIPYPIQDLNINIENEDKES